MINLCIIGAGDVVQVRHAEILKSLVDSIKVKSIVTTKPESAKIVSEKLGYKIQHFNNIDDALTGDVDSALVAVSTGATNTVASYLLAQGLSLYVEKPLAHDMISGAKFVEEAVRLKRPVVIGENFQKQLRFNTALEICEDCSSKAPSALIVRDLLRRGARINMRTDTELFIEHGVHFISAIRKLSQAEVTCINHVASSTIGNNSEYHVNMTLSTNVPAEVTFTVANVWSEDRYILSFDGADTRIAHNYNFERRAYDDRIEHYHGVDELVKVIDIAQAECGIRMCWEEFIQAVSAKKFAPSPSLLSSLNDIQVRDAIQLSLLHNTSVPLVPFS